MFKKPVAKEPQTEAEKHRQALVTANVLINDNRGKFRKPMENYQKVANSNYWFYGYTGGCMMSTMAACLALGNRIPVLGRSASWIALIVGYYGGKSLHGLHNSYNLAAVVKVIDENIVEMHKMNEKHGNSIPDYAKEISNLTRMKHELQPHTPEAQEASSQAAMQSQLSINDRADALVAAYERKKKL